MPQSASKQSAMPSALFVLLVATLSVAACSKPEPPDKDRPPEPQASSTARKGAEARMPPATELRDYMQRDIKRAQAAEDTVLEAGEQQRADIDAQTAGNPPPPPMQ